MKNKFWLIFATLICVFALAACDTGDGNDTTASTQTTATITEATTTAPGTVETESASVTETSTEAETSDSAPTDEPKELEFKSNGDGSCYVNGIGNYKDSNVIIPAVSPDGDSVTAIGSYAFYNCSNIESVVIPNGVVSIGDSAFYGCSNLAIVNIPDGVKEIGSYAFYNSNIKSAFLPEGVESIGEGAYYRCSNLTEVSVPQTISSIGSKAFSFCTNLDYNGYDNAHYIGNEVNPYLVLIEAKSKSIKSCEINGDTKIIGKNAFSDCAMLTDVTIPDGVQIIDWYAFKGCAKLSEITLPSSIVEIGSHAFYDCLAIESLTIPDSISYIGILAFGGCTGLDEVTFESTDDWSAADYLDTENTTKIKGLDTPSVAAAYLTDTYKNNTWTRGE